MVERDRPTEHEPRFAPAQEAQLRLIELASSDGLDGHRIVEDLRANPGIWRAALIGNFGDRDYLRALRDLPQGFFNAQTLFLLTERERAAEALELAFTWNASEVRWLPRREVARALGDTAVGNRMVLRLWWE